MFQLAILQRHAVRGEGRGDALPRCGGPPPSIARPSHALTTHHGKPAIASQGLQRELGMQLQHAMGMQERELGLQRGLEESLAAPPSNICEQFG